MLPPRFMVSPVAKQSIYKQITTEDEHDAFDVMFFVWNFGRFFHFQFVHFYFACYAWFTIIEGVLMWERRDRRGGRVISRLR